MFLFSVLKSLIVWVILDLYGRTKFDKHIGRFI